MHVVCVVKQVIGPKNAHVVVVEVVEVAVGAVVAAEADPEVDQDRDQEEGRSLHSRTTDTLTGTIEIILTTGPLREVMAMEATEMEATEMLYPYANIGMKRTLVPMEMRVITDIRMRVLDIQVTVEIPMERGVRGEGADMGMYP